MSASIIDDCLNLPNCTIEEASLGESGGRPYVELRLSRETTLLICSKCQGLCYERYDHEVRRIRDLSVFAHDAYLLVEKWRVACPSCGVRVEDLGFADPYSRHTLRLEEQVARLCRWMPVSQVAELLGLDWRTVKDIDKRALQRQFGDPDYSGLRRLAIDEISYRRRHHYLTQVLDLDRNRVIWVGRGRRKATLRRFFDEVGPEVTRGIQAIAIDMWEPYIEAICERAPQAAIVFDHFHVVRTYHRKVVDRVRIDETKKAEEEHEGIYKGTKYLLLKNKERLSEEDQSRLEALLRLNHNLNVVYVLKEDLELFWKTEDPKEAREILQQWTETARESGLKPLEDFAEMLETHAYGLLSHCEFPISTGQLEGLNNKVKVIQRRCYGFHDLEYLGLKIMQASSRKPP